MLKSRRARLGQGASLLTIAAALAALPAATRAQDAFETDVFRDAGSEARVGEDDVQLLATDSLCAGCGVCYVQDQGLC